MKQKETIENSYKDFRDINRIDDRDNFDDERLDNFEQKIESWLRNVETEEEKQVFLYLLKNYKYYNKHTIANSFKNGFSKFKNAEANYEDSIYMGVGSRGGVYNGSSELMPIFKRSNKIDKLRIADKPRDFYEKYDPSSVENVVLVDDIIGSGTTVKRYIEENLLRDCPELVLGKKIYIICVIALEKGLTTLDTFARVNNLFIDVIYEDDIGRTFDVNNGLYTNKKERISAKRTVKKYDTQIARREIDILGYKDSQGLVSFYHNTPNNTFPIFWEDPVFENNNLKVPWSPLLGRDQGIKGLPEREKPTHENLEAMKREKEFKDRLYGKIVNELKK